VSGKRQIDFLVNYFRARFAALEKAKRTWQKT